MPNNLELGFFFGLGISCTLITTTLRTIQKYKIKITRMTPATLTKADWTG